MHQVPQVNIDLLESIRFIGGYAHKTLQEIRDLISAWRDKPEANKHLLAKYESMYSDIVISIDKTEQIIVEGIESFSASKPTGALN